MDLQDTPWRQLFSVHGRMALYCRGCRQRAKTQTFSLDVSAFAVMMPRPRVGLMLEGLLLPICRGKARATNVGCCCRRNMVVASDWKLAGSRRLADQLCNRLKRFPLQPACTSVPVSTTSFFRALQTLQDMTRPFEVLLLAERCVSSARCPFRFRGGRAQGEPAPAHVDLRRGSSSGVVSTRCTMWSYCVR